MITTVLSESEVQSVIGRTFRISPADGWFYPTGGIPLVRILVSNGEFRVERRRRPTSDWISILSLAVHEFDQSAFDMWTEHWPLVA